MYVSASESRVLARIFGLLSEDLSERDVREAVGHHLLELLEADYYASFVWQDSTGRFEKAVYLNMDPANIAAYDRYFQQRDPITLKLQARREATLGHAGDAAARFDADRVLQRFPRPRRPALGRQCLQLCRRPQYRRRQDLARPAARQFRRPYAGAAAADRAGLYRRAGPRRRRSGGHRGRRLTDPETLGARIRDRANDIG